MHNKNISSLKFRLFSILLKLIYWNFNKSNKNEYIMSFLGGIGHRIVMFIRNGVIFFTILYFKGQNKQALQYLV